MIKQNGYSVDVDAGVVYGKRGAPIGSPGPTGYVVVNLYGCEKPTRYLHRMVWEAAHGPIPDGLEINHINGDKLDNRLVNLELVTRSENIAHSWTIGARAADGERNNRSILTEDQVREIREARKRGETQAHLARRHGVSRSTIANIDRGATWAQVA